MTTVTLSLVSHTNVGKTTLARTLLRRDVGEVEDRAHVTESSEAHVLIETGGARLRLWDTPGFGDTARLVRRLRRESAPLGWFLHQVWDRVIDRPLWCSQAAARNIRDEADVVLYLVNAAETPQDAGYVPLELELITWIGRPVLLLLNQIGDEGAEVESWREFTARWPVVSDVLALDAFTRCWTEEGLLLQRVVDLLDGEKQSAMRSLSAAWSRRNLDVYRSCCEWMAQHLACVATDRENADTASEDRPSERGIFGLLADTLKATTVDRRRAMTALSRRLDRSTQELTARMIAAHGLVGDSAVQIEQRLQNFQIRNRARLDERSGAVVGAVVSGAVSGVLTDALSGGLTLGGGLIAGMILGALGGSALARGYRFIGGDEVPSVRWADEFLDRLLRQILLRYLAVAHYGRGRGRYSDLEQPQHWNDGIEDALGQRRESIDAIWKRAASVSPDDIDSIRDDLVRCIDDCVQVVLTRAYPRAAVLFEPEGTT